jgi:thermitase
MAAQKFRYKVDGKYVNLDIDQDYLAVQFKEPALMSIRENVIKSTDSVGDFSNRIEIPNERFTVFKVAENQEEREVRLSRAEDDLNKLEDVAETKPIFKYGNQRLMATEKISVGLDGKEALPKITKKYNLKAVRHFSDDYIFELPVGSNVFDMIENIEKESYVKFAEPNFAIFNKQDIIKKKGISRSAISPLDSQDLSGQQYALNVIEANKAWDLQKGNPTITIAIIDEGVDTNHPNYRSKVTGKFDAIDEDSFQEPNSWDGHGTACAGLAAAEHLRFGIKGVAGGCSIMAVRIASSDKPNGDWHTTDEQIVAGIDWAWENGADILSNSWGGGPPSSLITNAIARANNLGRDGKGCVVLFAAGNEDGDVSFPATIPTVISVAASNQFDEPKTKNSRDGESWWGSNHGPQVDISAPGVGNLTTDMTASAGYDRSDYYALFNGTSSATPIVAGVAALVLSANPALSGKDVRDILIESADKVGTVTYSNGHNDRMGFGRVNAFKAIMATSSQTSTLNTVLP